MDVLQQLKTKMDAIDIKDSMTEDEQNSEIT